MDDPGNYRGITLLSCVGKLFTACLNSRLSLYLESAGILGDEQAGFRDGFCTLDHIFVLNSLVELYLCRGKRIYCAFIDYKKAFDLVDRSNLWAKLISCGINGNVIKVVYNMYDQAKSCVKVGNTISNFFDCNVGVRQGENLSPLLFAVYLNDFEYFVSRQYRGLSMCSSELSTHLSNEDVQVFLRLYVLLYADDTIVMAETAEELQTALNAVHEYCNQWLLTVNASKTKIVIFSRGKVRRFPDFTFGDQLLEVVEDYVYLGTTFNYNGNFHKAINKQITQSRRAMFNLLHKAKRLHLPLDIICELYDSLVVPILLYGSEIWGFQDMKDIEIQHRKFLKNILKVRKGTANCMVYAELGRKELKCNVNNRMLNFWLRIAQDKECKLSNIMYRLLRKLHDTGEFSSNWICKIKTILDECGLSNIWQNCSGINKTWFKNCVNLKICDIEQQLMLEEINSNRFVRIIGFLKQGLSLKIIF
jgi:hypothetical protein